jgi:hypothetical protein
METGAKFKQGEIVVERTQPARKLVVSRYMDRIYYCKARENSQLKTLVYFERDLMAVAVSGTRQTSL